MSDNLQLCTDLLRAESEDAVVELLQKRGYWTRPELWRHYGDVENNWGQSGNQQSLAEAALAEKIVNSVDARLINECRERGIDPSDAAAPQSVRSAVSQFFEKGSGKKLATGGYVEDWSDEKIREVAEGITLTATGLRPEQLNLTIADCGEGQTPDRLPNTILSLGKSNKLRVPFVQGKFNQGGTGALSFCGSKNLQLVLSRRNPALMEPGASGRDAEWGFTVVRREFPTGEAGAPQSSMYTYLAPVGVGAERGDRQGEVLSFSARSFQIYPNDHEPFGREAFFGTAIKLYDYRFIGERSNILRGKSLLSRLDLLLPEIALPVRFYEYRTDKAGRYLDVGSRRTSMAGLLRRIKDSANVVEEFPVKLPFQVEGEKLFAQVFAFVPEGTARDTNEEEPTKKVRKLGGVKGYRKNEGIVFVRNGQTQGSLTKDFFRRDAVKMKPLADDLLVFVECDDLSPIVRENLFMTSRDRLRDGDFKQSLLAMLESTLRDCHELKELRNRRQQERLNARLEDDKPLTDVLQALIKNSPNLTTLLQLGQRISAPFNTKEAGSDQSEPFKGEVYPTFFKNKGIGYGEVLKRPCPINARMRLTFETDARNDYFTRSAERGAFDLTWTGKDGTEYRASPSGPVLKNGIATAMIDLPNDVEVGDQVVFTARTHDSQRLFENRITVTVKPKSEKHTGGSGERKPPKGEGHDREQPTELAQPRITPVYRGEWEQHGFNEMTAMQIAMEGYTEDETAELYEFKVNMDNLPLENEAKQKRLSENQFRLLRQQFMYANVLVGLSLLLEDKKAKRDPSEDSPDAARETIEAKVELTCRALAPFIPALISLGEGSLEADDPVEGLEEAV